MNTMYSILVKYAYKVCFLLKIKGYIVGIIIKTSVIKDFTLGKESSSAKGSDFLPSASVGLGKAQVKRTLHFSSMQWHGSCKQNI